MGGVTIRPWGVVYSRFVGAKGSLLPACSQAIYCLLSLFKFDVEHGIFKTVEIKSD